MGFIDWIKNAFRKEKEENINKLIIINMGIKSQSNGHALLVANSDGYKDLINYVSSRRVYSCNPRDIDENWDEEKIKDILKKNYNIYSISGFFDVFGKGTLSDYRTIIFLFPHRADDLPEELHNTWIADVVIKKQVKQNIIDLLKQKDINTAIAYKQTMSVYSDYLQQDWRNMAKEAKTTMGMVEKDKNANI